MQGSTLFYFTDVDSPQPRGIIPVENAIVTPGERTKGIMDRRDKYIIKVIVDPCFELKKEFYLLSARNRAGQEGWIAVCPSASPRMRSLPVSAFPGNLAWIAACMNGSHKAAQARCRSPCCARSTGRGPVYGYIAS